MRSINPMSYRGTQQALDSFYKEWRDLLIREPKDVTQFEAVSHMVQRINIMADFQRLCDIEGIDAAVELTKRVYLNPPWVAI
jgi:hypothetical protein